MVHQRVPTKKPSPQGSVSAKIWGTGRILQKYEDDAVGLGLGVCSCRLLLIST